MSNISDLVYVNETNNRTGRMGEYESLIPNVQPSLAERLGFAEEGGIGLLAKLKAENEMRLKLRFFFMNPIEKWQAKQRFPYKFLLQVFKIVFVSIQLSLFAHSRYCHVNYTWNNRVTFSHLFLRGWTEEREINVYPPTLGPLAFYNTEDFYNTIDYAVNNYGSLSDAIGPYSYPNENNTMEPPILCISNYEKGVIFGFNESYMFNSEILTDCYNIVVEDSRRSNFSSKEFFKNNSIVIIFSALVRANLSFAIKTVNLKAAGPISGPDCYKFNIQILLNNEDNDGQVKLSLDTEPERLICKGDMKYKTSDSQLANVLRSILNGVVILICVTSFVLCSRGFYKAHCLKLETMQFFRDVYNKELSLEGRFEFWNFWYIMIIINDILLIGGSALKEEIERKEFIGDQWNTCSLLLGTGNLLVWFGLLRYLGFFKNYNVVILTLKEAFPKVARFLLCAILIYAGFTFCGWLVLGPYHMKFRSLAGTSECLFALINGDDMYATFSMMDFKSPLLWWFSRIYLYTFICLYIYVVLSLFISVIMDAYETIKLYYKEGFPKSDLQQFVAECREEATSGVFRSTRNPQNGVTLRRIVDNICCCRLSLWISRLKYNLRETASSTELSLCS